MLENDPTESELLQAAGDGDVAALAKLLKRYRQRLKKLVQLHMDPRMARRLNASDVVQETLLDAYVHIADYVRDQSLPFYPWLRQLTLDRLARLHRFHLRTEGRTVLREVPLSDKSFARLVDRLATKGSSPSVVAERAEMHERLERALAQLDKRDRKLLVLRFFEQLSLRETAAILGISVGAVSMRQLRALDELRTILEQPDL